MLLFNWNAKDGNGLGANVQNFLTVISANANALNLLTIVSLSFIDVLMIFNVYLKHVTVNSGAECENWASADAWNFLTVIGADADALNLLTIVSLLFINVEIIFNGYLKHVTI